MMNIDNRKIGFKIKLTREEKNISRESLAEKMGVSKSYIYRVEAGRSGFSLKTIKKFADALEVDVNYFLTWGDTEYYEKMGVKDQQFEYGKKIDTLELLIERLADMLNIDPEQLTETLQKKPRTKLELIIELLEKLPSDQQKKIVTRLIEKSYKN